MRAAIVHGAKWNVAKNRVDKAIEEYEKGEIDFLIHYLDWPDRLKMYF